MFGAKEGRQTEYSETVEAVGSLPRHHTLDHELWILATEFIPVQVLNYQQLVKPMPLMSIDSGAAAGTGSSPSRREIIPRLLIVSSSAPRILVFRIEDDAFKHSFLLQSVHRCARVFDPHSDLSNGEVRSHNTFLGVNYLAPSSYVKAKILLFTYRCGKSGYLLVSSNVRTSFGWVTI